MTTVGLWGAGVGGSVYATAARLLGWSVGSVGSRDVERAATLAGEVGAFHSFALEAGTNESHDVTIIATPPSSHGDMFESVSAVDDVVIVAPLASTLAEADRMIDAPAPKRCVLGWPLITAPTTQELVRRASTIGTPTNLSMASSRPLPSWGGYSNGDWGGGVAHFAAHDHLALTLLLARFIGLGTPATASAAMSMNPSGVDIAAEMTLTFETGFTATVAARWTDENVPRSEIQLAGIDGVLRIDGNPAPTLEHDGSKVLMPRRPIADEQFRPLYDAGLVDLLKTVEAEFGSDRALPHAFTLDFGREVGEVIAAAYWSAGLDSTPVPLPFGGSRTQSPLELFRAAAAL